MNPLNRNSPIPLYYQIKKMILQKIEKGVYVPGSLIPSERELSELFQISRMTVRQALVELMNEGKLIREKGKGTFVAFPKLQQPLTQLTSFSEDMKQRGVTPGSRILEVAVLESVPVEVANNLNLQDKSDEVLKIQRVRLANDQPLALETSFLPLSRFEGLDRHDFENSSIYNILEADYLTQIKFAKQSIEVGLSTKMESTWLKMEIGSPIMHIERTTYDQYDIPIEFAISTYRGDKYKFYIEMFR